MASFTVRNGCFYYKGRPFIKTSAYGGGDYLISLPDELVTTDKNLYLRAGFTSVDFFAQWRRVRPAEGEWNLEPLRNLLRKARRMGITVFIHFYLTPPRWMVEKYGWYWITETGRRVPLDIIGGYPHDEAYLREVDEYVRRLIEVGMEYEDALGDYWLCGEHWPFLPSFKERKIYGTREDASYDDYTVAKFRRWLSEQFTLDELSVRWHGREGAYSSWDDVYPPVSMRKADFAGRPLPKWRVARWDWYRFKQHVAVDVLTRFCETVRKYDPARPVSLEMNMDLPGWSGYQRWYKVCARAGNARGAIQDFEASYVRALYYVAIARGASEPPHQVNEMSGFQDYRWCVRNAWFVQAMGGTGMTFWDFKSDYWGVVTSSKREYDPRERVQFKPSFLAVSELNRTFKRLSGVLGASPPLKPSVGVLMLDEDAFHESGVTVPPAMRFLSLLLRLHYGSETAVISEDHLLDGRVRGYKLVIAPHVKYISKEEAERLEEYVRGGGTLILGPFCGERDETGEPYGEVPCAPLARAAGLRGSVDELRELLIHLYRVKEYLPERVRAGNWLLETFSNFQAAKMSLTIDRTFALDYLKSLFDAHSSTARVVEDFYELKRGAAGWCLPAQAVEPKGARVVAESEAGPAVLVNRYGQGTVVYLAAELEERLLEAALRSALAAAGLPPCARLEPEDDGVFLGFRRAEGGYLVFAIEVGDREHDLTLVLNRERMGLSGEARVRELLSGEELRVSAESPRVPLRLRECEVKVFHVRL